MGALFATRNIFIGQRFGFPCAAYMSSMRRTCEESMKRLGRGDEICGDGAIDLD